MSATEVDSIVHLSEGLVGNRFESIQILGAAASIGEDSSGERALYLRLTLSDPDGSSWPVDEIYEMQRAIRAEAGRSGITEMVYFNLWPEHPAPLAPDVPAPDGE